MAKIFLAILLLSFIVFLPSFNLSVHGDEWLAAYRYFNLPKEYRGIGNLGHLSYFLTTYGMQDISFGFLYSIFGTNSSDYYILAFILRMIAAISFYPLLIFLLKDRLSAYFGVLFFAITTVGIETTNWVFNMPSYLAIAFFNLFLLFFLKSRITDKFKDFSFSLVFLFLTFTTSLIRMTGLLPFVVVTELVWLVQSRFKNFQKISFRVISYLAIFILIITLGYLDYQQFASLKATNGINQAQRLILHGNISFLLSPVITVGNLLFPNVLIDQAFNPHSAKVAYSLIGMLFTVLALVLGAKFRRKYGINNPFFLGLIWLYLSFLLAWWQYDVANQIYSSTHRHVVSASIGLTIILAAIFSLKNYFDNKLIPVVLSLILVWQAASTFSYLKSFEVILNKDLDNKIWSQINYFPNPNKARSNIYFFQDNGLNANIIGEDIIFNFPARMALTYNLNSDDFYDPKDTRPHAPTSTPIWNDLVYLVKSGTYNIDEVYAYALVGQNKLIDVTLQVRQRLTKEPPL